MAFLFTLRSANGAVIALDARRGELGSRGFRLADRRIEFRDNATGVTFSVELDEQHTSAVVRVETPVADPVASQIAAEVSWLIEAFDLVGEYPHQDPEPVVEDPELEVVQRIAFESRLELLRALTRGASPEAPAGRFAISGFEIHKTWTWNHDRAQLAEGRDEHVPLIGYGVFEGTAQTMVEWPELRPIVLPTVSLVLVRFDATPEQPHPRTTLLRWNEFPDELAATTMQSTTDGMPYRVVHPSSHLRAWIHGRSERTPQAIEPLTVGQLIEKEQIQQLMTASRSNRPSQAPVAGPKLGATSRKFPG